MTPSEATRQQPALEPLEPNQFALQGYDGLQILYSTTSVGGQPQFNFTGRGEPRNFSGSEILVEDAGLGRMVTVMLRTNQADEGFESLTLLLPSVQMVSPSDVVSLQTFAILSRRFVFVAPGSRQLQTYSTLTLSGTAQLVQFLAGSADTGPR